MNSREGSNNVVYVRDHSLQKMGIQPLYNGGKSVFQ